MSQRCSNLRSGHPSPTRDSCRPPLPPAHTHLRAVLELKFVKESPGIPQVRVYLHCSVEPFSGLGYFTLTPEQPVKKPRASQQTSFSLEEPDNLQALQLYRYFNFLLSQEGINRFWRHLLTVILLGRAEAQKDQKEDPQLPRHSSQRGRFS